MQPFSIKHSIRTLTLASSILFLSVPAFAQQHTPRSHGSDSRPPREQSQRETESVRAPASVAGTWHVVVPGWGIEDHLLVVEEHDGVMAGKFEFADIKGTVAGKRVQFDVTDAGGRLLIHFEGRVSGDKMEGRVTSPEDGPLLQHQPGNDRTTEWTANREGAR